MNLTKTIETLQIIAKYADGDKQWCSAEHDILFLPLDNSHVISDEDENRLIELGAFRSSEGDCWALFT